MFRKGFETVPQVLENVIVAAAPGASDYTVTLTWANGAQTRGNFARLAGKGVFVPLADPDTFKKVRVGDFGRSLVWPGDIDFCADALWFEAHPEDAPSPQRSAERTA